MTITVEVDFCKENISDFGELAKSAFQYAMEFGRELVRRILEERDAELRKNRDTARYSSGRSTLTRRFRRDSIACFCWTKTLA